MHDEIGFITGKKAANNEPWVHMQVDIDEKKIWLISSFTIRKLIANQSKKKKSLNGAEMNDLIDLHVLDRRMLIWKKNAGLNE